MMDASTISTPNQRVGMSGSSTAPNTKVGKLIDPSALADIMQAMNTGNTGGTASVAVRL